MKKIIITGNVGRDPEIRNTKTGEQFVSFSVAVSVGTKDNPKTDWCDISVYGRQMEYVRSYVKRGARVMIEGFPTVDAYIGKDGQAKSSLRIFCNNIEQFKTGDIVTNDETKSDTMQKQSMQDEETTNRDHMPF
jgi:single-strand DNA-binding protein